MTEWMHITINSPLFTSAPGGGECLASRPGSFTARGRTPGIHWIGGWVDTRAGLDTVKKRKASYPDSWTAQPVFVPTALPRHINIRGMNKRTVVVLQEAAAKTTIVTIVTVTWECAKEMENVLTLQTASCRLRDEAPILKTEYVVMCCLVSTPYGAVVDEYGAMVE
jgi:hypothetical protein